MVRPCAMWFLFVLAGCGASPGKDDQPVPAAVERPDAAAVEQPAVGEEAAANGGKLERKLIYRAELDIVVEDFSEVPAQVQAVVSRFDAFVADSQITGTAHEPRYAYWTVRVPADKYVDFLDASRRLGEVRRESQTAEDVSDEFYDIEARLANQQQEEQRLKELLDKHSGTLEDILAVEREIARVREEIERLQGRHRVLTDLTAYSTVTLRFDEVTNYEPEHSATFMTRIRRTWWSSIDAIGRFGQTVALTLVFFVPWFCLVVVPLVALFIFLRRRRKKSATS